MVLGYQRPSAWDGVRHLQRCQMGNGRVSFDLTFDAGGDGVGGGDADWRVSDIVKAFFFVPWSFFGSYSAACIRCERKDHIIS